MLAEFGQEEPVIAEDQEERDDSLLQDLVTMHQEMDQAIAQQFYPIGIRNT
jgi:hypothetical protein